MKPQKRGYTCEDWRGNAIGAILDRFSNLSNITNTVIMMKRE
jgi:hypothetical protein